MNIGCLLDSVSRKAGGLHDSVRRLAQCVAQDQDVIRVFSLEDEHTAEDLLHWAPLEVQTFPPRLFRAWGYASQLTGALCDANLDVLLTHGIWKYSSRASLNWHRRTGKPVIIHPHGMLDSWAVRNSRWKKLVAALLYENAHLRSAACLRALCEPEAQAIQACGLRNPICVIPNGIDLPDLEAVSSSEFQVPALKGRKVLLYLGRLHPKKNLGPLLQAWAVLQKDCSAARNWALAIAGWDQGGYEEELKAQCEELGLLSRAQKSEVRDQKPAGNLESTPHPTLSPVEAERVRLIPDLRPLTSTTSSVHFLGPLFGEAKAAAYRDSAAFVLPSLSEGLPMVVLEAWAYSVPVLMTDECNLPEGFAAGAALRIGAAAETITPGLRQLMEMNDTDRIAFGARGRALVAQKFLWPQIGAEMRRVCEWAVGGGALPDSVRLG